MLYREIIEVFFSEIHTKYEYLKAVCGQNGEFLYVKPGGKYIDHWDINSNHKMLIARRTRLP
jgi:hypothetical protein